MGDWFRDRWDRLERWVQEWFYGIRPENSEPENGGEAGGTARIYCAEEEASMTEQKDDTIIRRHYIFYGTVQGVGFRYRARYGAMDNRVTGWVRNLGDGTVEMEAQGRSCDIARMIAQIRMGHYVDIVDMDVKEIPVDPRDSSFHVR